VKIVELAEIEKTVKEIHYRLLNGKTTTNKLNRAFFPGRDHRVGNISIQQVSDCLAKKPFEVSDETMTV